MINLKNLLIICSVLIALCIYVFYYHLSNGVYINVLSADFSSRNNSLFFVTVEVENKTDNDISLWSPDSFVGKDVWSFVIKEENGVLLRIFRNSFLENHFKSSDLVIIPSKSRINLKFNLLDGTWLWPIANMDLQTGDISKEVFKGKKISVEINENNVDSLSEFEIPKLWVGHIQSKMMYIRVD